MRIISYPCGCHPEPCYHHITNAAHHVPTQVDIPRSTVSLDCFSILPLRKLFYNMLTDALLVMLSSRHKSLAYRYARGKCMTVCLFPRSYEPFLGVRVHRRCTWDKFYTHNEGIFATVDTLRDARIYIAPSPATLTDPTTDAELLLKEAVVWVQLSTGLRHVYMIAPITIPSCITPHRDYTPTQKYFDVIPARMTQGNTVIFFKHHRWLNAGYRGGGVVPAMYHCQRPWDAIVAAMSEDHDICLHGDYDKTLMQHKTKLKKHIGVRSCVNTYGSQHEDDVAAQKWRALSKRVLIHTFYDHITTEVVWHLIVLPAPQHLIINDLITTHNSSTMMP